MYILCICSKVGMFWKLYSTCVVAPERQRSAWSPLTLANSQNLTTARLQNVGSSYPILPFWPSLRPTLLYSISRLGTLPSKNTTWLGTHCIFLGKQTRLILRRFHPMSTLVDGESHRFSGSFSGPGHIFKVHIFQVGPFQWCASEIGFGEIRTTQICLEDFATVANWRALFGFSQKMDWFTKLVKENRKMIWINLKKKQIKYMIW